MSYRLLDTIEQALDETSIQMPFPTYDLNLGAEAENSNPAIRAFSD